MSWIIDSVIDWFWVGFVLKLREKYPAWIWVTAMLSPLILLGALFGSIYLATR